MIIIAKYLNFDIINEFQYAVNVLGSDHRQTITIALVRNRRKGYENIFNSFININK